jgi:hypothetical protein
MSRRRLLLEIAAAAGVLGIVAPFYGWLAWELMPK